MATWLEWWTIVKKMLLVKQHSARQVPGWVTHGSCSGADVELARFTTLVAACSTSSQETTLPCL